MSIEQLREVSDLARQGYDEVRRRCPDLPALGGCLLLGRHYAHPASRVLFLGLNPGGADTKMDVGVQVHNYLLEGPRDAIYWTNARKFFSCSRTLTSLFSTATFSFCCPYRTPDWINLADHQRRVLIGRSRPVLRQIIADCRPALIVVAGRTSLDILEEEILRPEWYLTKVLSATGSGIYQWAAHRGSYQDRDLLIAQVPHFSRANSMPPLQECAMWLEQTVRASLPELLE